RRTRSTSRTRRLREDGLSRRQAHDRGRKPGGRGDAGAGGARGQPRELTAPGVRVMIRLAFDRLGPGGREMRKLVLESTLLGRRRRALPTTTGSARRDSGEA